MRERILERIRAAEARRGAVEHPGALEPEPLNGSLIEAFTRRFEAAGGEVVVLESMEAAGPWLRGFAVEFASAAVSPLVPEALRPALPETEPAEAELGVSLARGAVADTGSVLLESREGRRLQLLPPTHLMWIPAGGIVATLAEALDGPDGPLVDRSAALALHSGPSKSADIGGMLVTGVHGPGRVIAAILSP